MTQDAAPPTRTLRFDEEVFSFTGRFPGTSISALVAEVSRNGGTALRGLGTTTTTLVCGVGPGTKLHQAVAKGLVILSFDAFQALMAEGALEVEVPVREVDASAEVFAEVRGLLNETPHVEGWAKLTRLLDRCPPEVEESAAHYAASYLDRWAAEIGAESVPRQPHNVRKALRLHETWEWREGLPAAHRWRLAPERWLTLMAEGAESPRFRLVTALSFLGARLNASRCERVIKNPALVNLRELYLGNGGRYSRGFFSHIASGPLYDQLELLGMDLQHTPFSHFARFGLVERASGVRRLVLRGGRGWADDGWSEEQIRRAVGGDCFANVTSVEVHGQLMHNGTIPSILARCPSLRRLIYRGGPWEGPRFPQEHIDWGAAAQFAEVLCFPEVEALFSFYNTQEYAGAAYDRLESVRAVELEGKLTARQMSLIAAHPVIQSVGAVWLSPKLRSAHRKNPVLSESGITVLDERPTLT